MKIKTTLILLVVFGALLAFIFLSDIREKGKPEPADKLVDLSNKKKQLEKEVDELYEKNHESQEKKIE